MPKSKIKVKSSFLKHPETRIENKRDTQKLAQRSSKKKINKKFVLILLSFIGTVLLVIGIFLSGLFNVKNYSINGNSQISSEDITNIVKKYSLNKLILSVDPGTIENELLKNFSLISCVRVTKSLPSTLHIELKERSKAITIKILDNNLLVSTDGVVLQYIDSSYLTTNTYDNTYVITLPDELKKNIGDKFDTHFISQILILIKALEDNKLSFDTIVINKGNDANIGINGTSILISINSDVDIQKVIANVNLVYKKLSQSSKIKKIDARLGDKIAVS